jgi:hypothetical protein
MLESVLALAQPDNRLGLLDLTAFEYSANVVGVGIGDPTGIDAAADRAWTHRIW